MDFTGRYRIPAPPETVWAGLTDPSVLAAAIPGCEALDKTGDSDFAGTVVFGIGPITASFKGRVRLSDMEQPHRLTLCGSGDGAEGGAEIVLTPKEGGTELTYTASATAGGKLAGLDKAQIDGAARQFADQFFERFAQAMESSFEPDPASAEPGVAVMPPAPVSAGAGPQPAGHSGIWALGLIGVVVVLLLLFLLVL